MKENKIEIIGSFIVIGCLIIMMSLIIFFMVGTVLLKKINVNNDNLKELFSITEEVSASVNLAEKYPFKNKTDALVSNKNNDMYFDKYLSFVNTLKSFLENRSSSGLIGYEKFVELSYNYNKVLGYKLVSNTGGASRIEISNGYFSRINTKKNIDNCARNLIQLNEYLKSKDIDYLYVQAPYKISETQKIPDIYKDYTNENINNLLKYIDKKVDYLDLRNSISGLKYFYKTDHHWLPEIGLLATNEITKYLNNNYNMYLNTENIEEDKYEYKIYPKMYFGYDGRNVSLANANPEDFTLITPKFDTKINIKIPELSINKTGTYKNTLIDWNKVKYGDFYKLTQYAAYMYGGKQLIEIKNENIKNNKKILFIEDSFGEVVSPFLAMETEYLSIIDLRYFSGSLKSYINSFNPDVVITMYNGGMLGEQDAELQNINLLWNNLNK